MRKLRVLALMHEHLVPPESIEGLSADEILPFRMEWDVSSALGQLGHEVHVLGVEDELQPIRQAIQAIEPHICFNLLTHFHDVGAYLAHVVSFLELLKTPYTGCNPRGLVLAGDKALSKKILAYHRISVPGFTVFRLGQSVRTARKLGFPMIVKSVSEQASQGIAQASVVRDLASLQQRVDFIHRNFGTDAIVEEYIEGRELNVGVLGNQRLVVLPLQELTFGRLPDGSEPIMTSRAKWDLDYQKRLRIESGPAFELPDGKLEEITRTAKRIHRALGLSGYARIDLRIREDGKVFILEANPNPDLCVHEDFAQSASQTGIEYHRLIQKIIDLGLQYRPAWKVR